MHLCKKQKYHNWLNKKNVSAAKINRVEIIHSMILLYKNI